MSRYLVHRSDANAEKVYAALEACGVHVEKIGRPVDALLYVPLYWSTFISRLNAAGVVVDNVTVTDWNRFEAVGSVLAEIKTAKGKTRSKAQAAFLRRWPGPILVLRSE